MGYPPVIQPVRERGFGGRGDVYMNRPLSESERRRRELDAMTAPTDFRTLPNIPLPGMTPGYTQPGGGGDYTRMGDVENAVMMREAGIDTSSVFPGVQFREPRSPDAGVPRVNISTLLTDRGVEPQVAGQFRTVPQNLVGNVMNAFPQPQSGYSPTTQVMWGPDDQPYLVRQDRGGRVSLEDIPLPRGEGMGINPYQRESLRVREEQGAATIENRGIGRNQQILRDVRAQAARIKADAADPRSIEPIEGLMRQIALELYGVELEQLGEGVSGREPQRRPITLQRMGGGSFELPE